MQKTRLSRWAWALAFFPIAAAIIWYGALTPASIGADGITTLTASNFEAITASKKMLFVEICTKDVCELQRPHLEKAAATYKDRITFVKIVVGESPDEVYVGTMQLAATLVKSLGGNMVEAFPTHMMVNAQGTPIGVRQGLLTAAALEGYIQEALKINAAAALLPQPRN